MERKKRTKDQADQASTNQDIVHVESEFALKPTK